MNGNERSMYQIRCCKCRTEYNPKIQKIFAGDKLSEITDPSCPICGYGQVKEESWNDKTKKQILKD